MYQREISQTRKLKLLQALPDFAKFPDQDIKVKQADYFNNNNENIWNKKSHSSNKQYQFYLKNKDDMKPIVEAQNKNEINAKAQQNALKNQYYQYQRERDLERLALRQAERIALQKESEQNIELNNFQLNKYEISRVLNNLDARQQYAIKKAQIYRMPQNIADNKWNDLSKLSKKQIKLLLRPEVIKNDEQAMINYLKNINEDYEIDLQRRKAFVENRQILREKFLAKKEQNDNISKKLSAASFISEENSFMKKFVNEHNIGTKKKSLEGFNKQEYQQQKLSKSFIPNQISDMKKMYEPRHPFDYPETSGLLHSSVDSKLLLQGGYLSKQVFKESKLLKCVTDQNLSRISGVQLSQLVSSDKKPSINKLENNNSLVSQNKRILDDLELPEIKNKYSFSTNKSNQDKFDNLNHKRHFISQEVKPGWDFKTNFVN